MKLVPTILCGGAGSRLWPVSREQHSKPFIRPTDDRSLFQKALLRGISLPGVNESIIVTNKDFLFKTIEETEEIKNSAISQITYIIEPIGRNTAAAITSSVLQVISQHGEDTLMLILAADHLILNQDAFQTAVSDAISLANQGKLVTFGIEPTEPKTEYGYIETEFGEVLRFIEKPNQDLAREYFLSGRFLWNSGIFLFSAGVMLENLTQYNPDIVDAVSNCIKLSEKRTYPHSTRMTLDHSSFSTVPSVSIDYAVMEKSNNIAIVPCRIGWSDVGSWASIDELTTPDENGNRIEGQVVAHDVANCSIKGNERMIGAIGLDNLIVIDTADALLIADKTRAQGVKHVFTHLKAIDHDTHKLHRTVHRPWGTYTVLEQGERFKIKRIEVKPGARLSLQMHHYRSERWIIVNGMAKVTNGENEFLIGVNQSTYIPAGTKHRLENPGILPLIMIEVQSGDYLGEEDIIRFEDNYDRI